MKINAIICDIDGTIADHKNVRGPFDWQKVDRDLPKMTIINLVKTLQKSGFHIIFLSGRDGICRSKTLTWLERYFDFEFDLFMRPINDRRKDFVIKKEIYENHIQEKYNIEFCLDDRNSVVDLWRQDLGLTCLQVDYGNF